ncbi:MAG: hypothetical protein IJA15_00905 [Clostridia bacterium]|nr:hypothetical protein [Clostridia bacterium]
MTDYFYLITSLGFVASSSILAGFYNKKTDGKDGASSLYTLLLMCSVFAFWLVTFLTDLQAHWGVVLYSLLFAGCYVICNVGLINALKVGSVALTSLLMQLALIGVTIWGFIFWQASITPLVICGLLLVVVALFLCLWKGKNANEKFNFKWLFYALLMFVGNAGCAIVQKTQQMQFDGKYGGFLMLIATGISLIISVVSYLRDKKFTDKKLLLQTCAFPVSAGICNGLLNLFVIILATSTLSPSLIYPVIAIGGLMLTTVFSAFIFKEKMYWWQWLGVLVGTVAVGILSI